MFEIQYFSLSTFYDIRGNLSILEFDSIQDISFFELSKEMLIDSKPSSNIIVIALNGEMRVRCSSNPIFNRLISDPSTGLRTFGTGNFVLEPLKDLTICKIIVNE